MQVKNHDTDEDENGECRKQNECYGRAGVDKNAYVPIVVFRWGSVYDKLRVGDNGRPKVGPLGLFIDADPEILNVMIDLAQPEVGKRETELVVAAVRGLVAWLVYVRRS